MRAPVALRECWLAAQASDASFIQAPHRPPKLIASEAPFVDPID
jgi:hypothetical protein